ncbi:VOC family protein [Nocardia sp. NPDC003482]
MSTQMNAVMLGVADLPRAKTFYTEALGATIDQDTPRFVALILAEGSPRLALYKREAAAADAGVPAEGSGFRGVSFHIDPGSRRAVDDLLGAAVAAGGSVVKDAAEARWGGYFGYFADPDGYLWKVTTYGS